MNTRSSLLLFGGLGTALAAVLALAPTTQAVGWGGSPVTRPLTLPPATGLDVGLFADVTVVEGSPQRITLTGSAARLAQVQAEVQDGVVYFRSSASDSWLPQWRTPERVKISVTLPAVQLLKLRGAGALTGLGTLRAPTLAVALTGAGQATLAVSNTQTNVAISGAGTVTMSGTTTSQEVSIDGAGSYHGFGLQSATTVASIAGYGSSEVLATRSLTGTIGGVGHIRYRGQPATIVRHISGLGKLEESQ
jgi:hypothetical protein